MITQTPWFERKFNFDFPPGLYPCILERLRGAYPHLVDMTRGLPMSVLTHKPNGKWSILEHIGHLEDLEELHEGRIDDFAKRAPVLRMADLKNVNTEKADHNEKQLDELLQGFQKRREHLIEHLMEADDETILFVSRHPRLDQQMRLVDMAYFVAEHDNHHMTRIRQQTRL